MKESIHIIFLILGFFAILVTAHYITKLLGNRLNITKKTRYIKIIDRALIANDKFVCIAQIGNRFFILGVTNHNIENIGEISESDLIPFSYESSDSFKDMFNIYTKKTNKNDVSNFHNTNKIQEIKKSLIKQKDKLNKL